MKVDFDQLTDAWEASAECRDAFQRFMDGRLYGAEELNHAWLVFSRGWAECAALKAPESDVVG